MECWIEQNCVNRSLLFVTDHYFWDKLMIDHFQIGPHAGSLLISYLLAFPIGWNREREERSAGLRTFPLVAVASCGFIQGAEHLIGDEPEALARLIVGIITGVGFIGGGAILQQKNSVRGTATAASLWVTGAIGVSVGVESYDVALMLTLIAFLTLQTLSPISRKLSPDTEKLDDTDNASTLSKHNSGKFG